MATTDGYYDHHPLRVLERPVAVIGFMGCDVRRVAHALATRQGLPFQDLERIVEHTAGMTRAQLVMEQGEPARRRLEREQLARVVRERPPPVLALGDGALLDADSLARVRADTTLVHVQRPLEVALAGITRELSASRASYPEFMLSAPDSAEALEALYRERLPGYRAADITISAHALSPDRVAARIAEALGWV